MFFSVECKSSSFLKPSSLPEKPGEYNLICHQRWLWRCTLILHITKDKRKSALWRRAAGVCEKCGFIYRMLTMFKKQHERLVNTGGNVERMRKTTSDRYATKRRVWIPADDASHTPCAIGRLMDDLFHALLRIKTRDLSDQISPGCRIWLSGLSCASLPWIRRPRWASGELCEWRWPFWPQTAYLINRQLLSTHAYTCPWWEHASLGLQRPFLTLKPQLTVIWRQKSNSMFCLTNSINSVRFCIQ